GCASVRPACPRVPAPPEAHGHSGAPSPCSRRSRRETPDSIERRSFFRCAGETVIRVEPLHRPAPVLRVLPKLVLLRLGRLMVGRNPGVNRYSCLLHASFLKPAFLRLPAHDLRSGCPRWQLWRCRFTSPDLSPFAIVGAWSA